MTDPANPLTADHIRVLKTLCEKYPQSDLARALDTIEQQAEQIEKHLAIFRRVRNRFELNGEPPSSDLFKDIRKVLASTESVNDTR